MGQRWRADEALASLALVLMALIPLVEILARPMLGKGVENAPILVQHLGLWMAMCGALAAERHGHLSSLGALVPGRQGLAHACAAVICGVLAWSCWQLVLSERDAGSTTGLHGSRVVGSSHHAGGLCALGSQAGHAG